VSANGNPPLIALNGELLPDQSQQLLEQNAPTIAYYDPRLTHEWQ